MDLFNKVGSVAQEYGLELSQKQLAKLAKAYRRDTRYMGARCATQALRMELEQLAPAAEQTAA